jgi:heterotetrameric sarcosine oxidase gamma subunit
MLERASALAGMTPYDANGTRIAEAADFCLTQAAGDVIALKTAFPKLPDRVGTITEHAGRTMLRIGPNQLWIIGTASEQADGIYLTPLSSSRTRIAVEGPGARDTLAKCAAIDFHPKVFTPGTFAMTGIHHMPALIHCTGTDTFHIYSLRTFALHLWEVLVDAAHS